MKKSAIVALVVFGVLPFSACNNGEQAAYMQGSQADANAREAEQAEQEFADLAAQEESQPVISKTEKKVEKKTEKKSVAKSTKKETPAKLAEAELASEKPVRAPASVKQTHAAMAPHGALWTVQMGAFKVKDNAEKLTAKLKADGFPAVMRSMNHSKNGELFLVHLEPTPNKSEAQKWQTDLKLKSFDSTLSAHRE